MAVKFLSEEWAQATTQALNEHEGFKNAIANITLGIQFVVTEAGEGGDVHYYLQASGGTAVLALGELEDADATVTNDYETATAVSKGELNTQTAFMTGKLKVSGNLAKLMMHQSAIQQWGAAVGELDVEY